MSGRITSLRRAIELNQFFVLFDRVAATIGQQRKPDSRCDRAMVGQGRSTIRKMQEISMTTHRKAINASGEIKPHMTLTAKDYESLSMLARAAEARMPDDIAHGRISVLTPVGAALIGLSAGDSITWETRKGEVRRLTVLNIPEPVLV